MRANDIVLNREYCLTGKLAYGNEPSVNRPDKVRFREKPRPGWGRLTRFESERNPGYDPDRKGTHHREFRWGRSPNSDGEVTWIVNVNDSAIARNAKSNSAMGLPTPQGPGEVEYTFELLKGFYPCERWNPTRERWDESICETAAIHRTWEAHVFNKQRAKERAHEHDVVRAPARFESAVREVVRQARLMGETDPAYAVGAIQQEWEKNHG